MPTQWDELLLAGGTVTYGVLLHRLVPERWHVPANVIAALASVSLARRAGASAADCGLRADGLGPAVRTGVAAAAVIAAGVAIAAAPARLRGVFADDRVCGHGSTRARYEVLVRIPLATAGSEEVLFRGAMLGVMLRRHSPAAAIARSSLCFGLWHVLPTLTSLRSAAAGRAATARTGAAAVVAGVVGVTAGAGTGFAVLRMRSGSVAASAIAHAALNVSAYIAARRAGRCSLGDPPGAGRGPGTSAD